MHRGITSVPDGVADQSHESQGDPVFVSFFIQFVAPAYPYPALSFLFLGIVVQLCIGLYLSILIFGGTHLVGQFRRRRRLSATATGGVGELFIRFGVKLAGASPG
jgi:leucine efflux protein